MIVGVFGALAGACDRGNPQSSVPGASQFEFTVYIERKDRPISLDEWKDAIRKIPDMRLSNSDSVVTNPETKQEIRIRNNGGDSEWLAPNQNTWKKVFYWGKSGRIHFDIDEQFSDPTFPVRLKAREIAEYLDAHIVDEYGTVYE